MRKPSGAGSELTHYWRIRKWHPERYGQPCRVLARGALNSVLIEFADGYRMVTSRWYVRKLPVWGGVRAWALDEATLKAI